MTGGSEGIGFYVSKGLVAKNVHVVIGETCLPFKNLNRQNYQSLHFLCTILDLQVITVCPSKTSDLMRGAGKSVANYSARCMLCDLPFKGHSYWYCVSFAKE